MINKYHAKKTVVDGIKFDSKKEAARYSELKILERAGAVKYLKLQPKFHFHHNDVKICTYIADFSYVDHNGNRITEDVKGVKTAIYKLKKKMMKAFYGIDILET